MHQGIFCGPTTPEHGLSRRQHSVICTDGGGETYTTEVVDLPSGTRVAFEYSSASGEQMAINVRAG
jgi:hypothetical protein